MKITKKTLDRMGACELARLLIDPLLPVALSTNPEDNLKLAMALHNKYFSYFVQRGFGYLYYDRYYESVLYNHLLWFLTTQRNEDGKGQIDNVQYDIDIERNMHDVLVTAQLLAMMADGTRV